MFNFRLSAQRIRPLVRVSLAIVAMTIFVFNIVKAVELPPDGSAAFIQTSGPNTPITIGDYYTSFQGQQDLHYVRVLVPCTWPGDLPVTFALFDPEIQEPDPPLSNPPPADDEIRDPNNNTIQNPPTENIQFADTTTYTLFAIRDVGQVDQVINPVSFVPTTSLTNTTNGRWVELVTFTPNTPNFGCGTYALATITSDNDDNAWKLSVSHDPDCTVSVPNGGSCSGIGQTQSAMLSNGNEIDSADQRDGTGDEILISLDQITYQHEGPGSTCQLFYHPVQLEDMPEITLNDFDLDINAQDPNVTVRHFSPSGAVYNGTPSRDSAWNNAPDPPPFPPQRGGDVYPVTLDDLGIWVTEICVVRDNQYIFEGQEDEIVFLKPPPIPRMAVSKDDGRIIVAPSDVLTYTIVFTNISNTDPFPLPPPANSAPPGAAFNVRLSDELPPYTTFVDCAINPPLTGACAEGPTGFVTFQINGIIPAGDGGSTSVTVLVDADAPPGLITDTVVLSYTGILNEEYPPVTDTDVNEILPTPTETPAPIPTPEPTATPRDKDDDDDDGGSTVPPPPPPPPTASPVPGEASVQVEPTPTPVVLFLPETGNQSPLFGLTIFGLILLVSLLVATTAYWRTMRSKRDA
ncbi:MAG: hypothetical protein KDI79_20930 [Anaerolineae bacterium]|nr:hypothetical protein [Anaerolineae bacterium]